MGGDCERLKTRKEKIVERGCHLEKTWWLVAAFIRGGTLRAHKTFFLLHTHIHAYILHINGGLEVKAQTHCEKIFLLKLLARKKTRPLAAFSWAGDAPNPAHQYLHLLTHCKDLFWNALSHPLLAHARRAWTKLRKKYDIQIAALYLRSWAKREKFGNKRRAFKGKHVVFGKKEDDTGHGTEEKRKEVKFEL